MPHLDSLLARKGNIRQLGASRLAILLLVLPLLFSAASGNADDTKGPLPGSDQAIEPGWRLALEESTDAEPQFVNRLALSGSAYLKQHADNPIDWYPWSDEAFQRAVDKNQLIFLSIGYASCHWCHVMERESFADPTVAEVLNRHLLSIKVDRELQPDVDAYYQRVVQLVRGESGWPVSVILTPDLKPVFAANYLDRAALITAAQRYAELWESQPALLQANAELLNAELTQLEKQLSGSVKFNPQWTNDAATQLLASLDPQHGGFGSGNKFPSEIQLRFLLDRYRLEPGPELDQVLRAQLDRLMTSGLVDAVFGGVFRYTTDRAMSRPHFEKMLYNQALVVSVYADAARWLNEPRYQAFAERIIAFSHRYLRLADGTYGAAIDAEHNGVEGGYYLWEDGLLQDLPAGIQRLSLREGKSYIYGERDSASAEQRLMQLEAQRKTPPRRVDNSITAWNALWLTALLAADRQAEAIALGNTLWIQRWKGQGLYRFAEQAGYLDDYAYLSAAFWALYQNTFQDQWKTRARALDQALLNRFVRDGTLYYTDVSAAAPLSVDVYLDSELPAPAAMALNALRRHSADGAFVNADRVLRNRANAAIALGPIAHLSVLHAVGMDLPDNSRLIAGGNGLIRLEEGSSPRQWVVRIQLDDGWHINAADIDDKQLTPTRIAASANELDIEYPPAKMLLAEFADDPLLVYDGDIYLTVNAEHDNVIETFEVSLQACSDRVCLLPENFRLTIQ